MELIDALHMQDAFVAVARSFVLRSLYVSIENSGRFAVGLSNSYSRELLKACCGKTVRTLRYYFGLQISFRLGSLDKEI